MLPAGCATAQQPAVEPVPSAAEDDGGVPRRPDGVVLEPPAAMPSVEARAEAHGVVSLREPLPDEALRQCVSAMMDAWQHKSIERLRELLTADAALLENHSGGRKVLEDSWRQRMHAHEYDRLAGLELVRLERVERWDWDALGGPDAPERPTSMRPGELYVRVPLEVTTVAGEKYFEDEIDLLVRPDGSRYRIAAYGERSR